MLFANRGDMAAKGDSVLGRAEVKAVEVARKVALGVGREEPDVVSGGAELEARGQVARGVEVAFVEEGVAAATEHRSLGNPEFLGRLEIVGQEPSANVRG